jgi:hypothetical protein
MRFKSLWGNRRSRRTLTLPTDPRRNQIGFVPASKLKPRDRYVLPDEWE